MTTREMYSSIGTSGYAHQDCWRKGGIFHLRMEAPQSCHKCPKCSDRNVIHRGTFDRMVHAPRIGLDRTVLFIRAPRLECRRCWHSFRMNRSPIDLSVPRTSFGVEPELRRIANVTGLRTLNGRTLVSAEDDKLEAYPTNNADKLEAYSTNQRDSIVVTFMCDCVNE